MLKSFIRKLVKHFLIPCTYYFTKFCLYANWGIGCEQTVDKEQQRYNTDMGDTVTRFYTAVTRGLVLYEKFYPN